MLEHDSRDVPARARIEIHVLDIFELLFRRCGSSVPNVPIEKQRKAPAYADRPRPSRAIAGDVSLLAMIRSVTIWKRAVGGGNTLMNSPLETQLGAEGADPR